MHSLNGVFSLQWVVIRKARAGNNRSW